LIGGQLQIPRTDHTQVERLGPWMSGTFPVDRFWGGERARRV
jgi:hypothetical protein